MLSAAMKGPRWSRAASHLISRFIRLRKTFLWHAERSAPVFLCFPVFTFADRCSSLCALAAVTAPLSAVAKSNTAFAFNSTRTCDFKPQTFVRDSTDDPAVAALLLPFLHNAV